MSRFFPPCFFLASGLSLALLAGCHTGGGVTAILPISGGQTIEMEFNSRGPVNAGDGDYKVVVAGCRTNPKLKEIRYAFGFVATGGGQPRRVQIDDVTEPQAVFIMDDTKPILDQGRWRGETKPFPATDSRFDWLVQIVNSTRIFRFTITDSEGRDHVLYQGAFYPVFYKQAIARALGLVQ